MRSLSRGFFTLCLALSAGFLLSVALRPRPPERTLPPHASRIRDLAFRFHVRPVLRGEAAPGNAGEWYRRAARLLLAGGGSDVLERFERGEEPDEDELRIWAGANREALDALRAGTRRAGSLLPVDWSEGGDAVVPEAGVGPSLAALAAAEAALAFRDERRLEAARILLDAARFGQDLARGGGVVHRLYA
ncbi:MAG: hypothetical protein MUC63_09655, partial [Planctomycetes bacterium]|nr:hypothetical protein [Planctomycetota bacterium]